MKSSKGYSLIEMAIVLLIVGLLSTAFVAGFGLYRDRAEFLASGRKSDLEELIAIDKRVPANEAPVEAPAPVAAPAPEPESTPEPQANDTPREANPFWTRWLKWYRDRRDRRYRRERNRS